MNNKTQQSSEKPFPKLNDSGKALLLLEAAYRASVHTIGVEVIPHNRVGPCLYLLDRDGILSTGYHFDWAPLPDSDQLHEDLTLMAGANHLLIDDKGNYQIANRGRNFLQKYIRNESGPTLNTMVQKILEMNEWDDKHLFEECYHRKVDN